MRTIKTYVGEVGRTVYPVDFDLGYLDRSHVYVYAGEVPTEQLDYTWPNSNQIELTTAFPTGEKFTIRRITPRHELFNDYENGAILEERNLDDSFKQTLMVLEEWEDGSYPNGLKMLNDIDMQGNRILNLPKPLLPHEPVRLQDIIDFEGGGSVVTGGGVVYKDELGQFESGETVWRPTPSELVFSYDDGNSEQWVAYPLLQEYAVVDVTVNASGGGTGNATVSNAGSTGEGLVLSKVGDDYPVKRVVAGTNTTLVSAPTSVTINSTTLSNAGATGVPLVNTAVAGNYPVKRLVAGANITLTEAPDAITVNATGGGGGGVVYSEALPETKVAGTTYFRPDSYETVFTYDDGTSVQYLAEPVFSDSLVIADVQLSGGSGEINTASNVGAGAGVFSSKVGTDLQFRSITGAGNTTTSMVGNNVQIASDTNANVGTGAGVFVSTTGGVSSFRRVRSSDSTVTVTEGTNDINLAVSALPYTSLTNVPTSSLIGRTVAGTGAPSAVSVGSGLSLSGGVLSATGGPSLGTALTALNALTPAADKLPYFTGPSTAALADITQAARNLLTQTNFAGLLAQLGITVVTNANGTSIRFPTSTNTSGIQICFKNGVLVGSPATAYGSVFISADAGWNFPQSFAGNPVVTGSSVANPYVAVIGGSTVSANSAQIRTMSGISDPGASFANLIAIGVY